MAADDLFRRTGDEGFSKFLKVLISGPPKSGKTTLLGTVPNILVLDTEPHANNMESIAHLNVPFATITNSEDLRYVASILGSDSLRVQMAQGRYGLSDIGAVAIDTMDTLQKLMKKERMREQKSSQFLRDDWGWLKTEMEAIVELFTALPMHVFFVVHTKTHEVGKGDDAYNIVLPGLEGAIAQSIAGMVGYSLLAFRREEIADDGKPYTKYWLQTEGDRTHDFLGTRTAGALPPVIEPDMKTIYDTVMANRPKVAPKPAPTSPAQNLDQPEQAPVEDGAPAQAEQEPTPVETSTGVAPDPLVAPVEPQEPTPPDEKPAAEKPDDNEPVTPAAMGHVKRVYDAIQLPFPESIVREHTMGEARKLVMYWRAVQSDHAEGKGTPGSSPQGEMVELMSNEGWLPAEGEEEAKPVEKTTEANLDGTIDEVKAWVGPDASQARIQEAFDHEIAGKNRKSLVEWLESKGAHLPDLDVSTPVETPSSPATESPGELGGQAEGLVKQELGGVMVEEQPSNCEVCGKALDDPDLAELGKKRFDKYLCVNDYLAQLKA